MPPGPAAGAQRRGEALYRASLVRADEAILQRTLRELEVGHQADDLEHRKVAAAGRPMVASSSGPG